MFQSILLMGGLGTIIGVVLVIASKAFYVYEDPKVVAVEDVLPGANCGGCGLPGCSANAEAIVKGKADVNSCVAAGDDVATAIAEIMGVSLSDKEPEFAGIGCYYGNDRADVSYIYSGIMDCRAAVMLSGGMKVCSIGCIGLGSCVRTCPFNALEIGGDGLPVVDQKKCTGCGSCEKVCPKGIIRLTSVTRRIMREYTKKDCVTPCQRACPTGINIREYIRLIKEGDYEASLQVIKERNPFPAVISRICPALCEFKCRRLLQDEPVAINSLKRFVCDYQMNEGKSVLPYRAPSSGKRVAVVGGGVEGLSAAYFTARLGHEPTVFEAGSSPGGILRLAISRKRLTMDILDRDIQGIIDMGVRIKTNSRAGRDFSISGLLRKGFDAVFTATGGWDSRLARGDINRQDRIFPGGGLLIDLVRSGPQKGTGKNIVIAGGGKELPDAVKILKETGPDRITVISRKDGPDQEMIDRLSEQGVAVIRNAGITKISGQEDSLTGIEYTELDTGDRKTIDADTLIVSSARFPEIVFVPLEEEEESSPLMWEGCELQKKLDSGRELGLLSDQDIVSEYPSAVAAINGGRRAAAAIHGLMYGIQFQDSSDFIKEETVLQDVSSLDGVDIMPRRIFDGLSEEVIREEAERCLECGLICYEKKL